MGLPQLLLFLGEALSRGLQRGCWEADAGLLFSVGPHSPKGQNSLLLESQLVRETGRDLDYTQLLPYGTDEETEDQRWEVTGPARVSQKLGGGGTRREGCFHSPLEAGCGGQDSKEDPQ